MGDGLINELPGGDNDGQPTANQVLQHSEQKGTGGRYGARIRAQPTPARQNEALYAETLQIEFARKTI